MFIPELYMRVCTNRKGAEKHFRRLKDYLPKTGAVTALKLTEKQFDNMIPLVGKMMEEDIGKNAHIMV